MGASLRSFTRKLHRRAPRQGLMQRGSPAAALHEVLVKQVAADLLRGLASVHDANIAHLDLKGGNIMVCMEEGKPAVRLVDYGCAMDLNQESTLDGAAGTSGYQAPELVYTWVNLRTGQQPRSVSRHIQAADVWSAGVCLVEAMFGYNPFSADSAGGAFAQQCRVRKRHAEWAAGYAPEGGKHRLLGDLAALGPQAFEFFLGVLETDPAKRLTAHQALAHPYLAAF